MSEPAPEIVQTPLDSLVLPEIATAPMSCDGQGLGEPVGGGGTYIGSDGGSDGRSDGGALAGLGP